MKKEELKKIGKYIVLPTASVMVGAALFPATGGLSLLIPTATFVAISSSDVIDIPKTLGEAKKKLKKVI